MWASVAASGFGDRIIMSAALVLLGAMAADAENSRVSLNAATQFWFFLPYLLWSFFAGWLVDHLPRKWILLSCDQFRALSLVVCLFMLWGMTGDPVLPVEQHVYVYGLLFTIGILAATFNPARNATVPQVVERSQLPSANALLVGLGVVSSMVGALAASKIINAEKGQTIPMGIIIAALLYAISGSFFAFLKLKPDHGRTDVAHRSMRQGVRYLLGHKRLLALIGYFTLVWGAAMIVYNAALTLGNLHFGLVGDDLFNHYQVIAATIGAGMLGGAAFIMLIPTARESTIILMLGMIGAAVSIAVFALVPVKWVHFPAGFCIGVFGNVAIVNTLSTLQALSPNYVRGRVMGITNIVSTVATVFINGVLMVTPGADAFMVGTLLGTSALVILVSVGCLTYHLRSGPFDRASANTLWRINRLFAFAYHRLRVQGQHHVPNSGAVLLVSNHTTALDPVLLQAPLPRIIRFVMLTTYLFPALNIVFKHNRPIALDKSKPNGDLAKLREVLQALHEGEVVGLFPEGGLQRTSRELKPFQPGVGMIARRSGATIVPVWIAGTPEAHSMKSHFLRRSRAVVRFGPGFSIDRGATDEETVALVRQKLLALANSDLETSSNSGETANP